MNTRILFKTTDRGLAEEVQEFLDENDIYTMISSDNPSSSVLTAYTGFNPFEEISMLVNELDHERAVEILNNSPYEELINN
jgi:hypothetical protein